MARHLAEHSYDVPTLIGHPVTFKDGCEGSISRSGSFASIRSVPRPLADGSRAQHSHGYEMAWETVAWAYIDKGKRFPNT